MFQLLKCTRLLDKSSIQKSISKGISRCSGAFGKKKDREPIKGTYRAGGTFGMEVEPIKRGEPLSENDHIGPNVVNRNPRNLEQICIARKNTGYSLENTRRDYWHKLFIDTSGHCIEGRIEHCSGKTVISASSKEWAIRRFLVSAVNVSAIRNVAKVLAQRCIESGILHVHHTYEIGPETSPKVELFLKLMEEGGVKLVEPEVISKDPHWI